MTPDNFKVQFTRGTTAQNDAYTGRDGELTIDTERKQLRLHDGVTPGGDNLGNDSVIVNVNSWAASDFVAPPGVVVTKTHGGSSISIQHNKGRLPTGWFALNRAASPMVGLPPTATRNIQVVSDNEVIITDVASLTQFDVSITFG